jgi:hypothetical protein
MHIMHTLGGHVGFQVLKKRWVVERTFAWLNRSRRLSKDFERTIRSSETMIYIASSLRRGSCFVAWPIIRLFKTLSKLDFVRQDE